MELVDFLRTIAPSEPGLLNAIVGVEPDGKRFTRFYDFSDRTKMFFRIYNYRERGVEIHHSMGAYRTFDGEKYPNRDMLHCERLNAVWLDLDVKPERAAVSPRHFYMTGEDMKAGLVRFLRGYGVPEPTFIVASGGGGCHVYWVLDRSITVDQWRTISHVLIEVAIRAGVLVDPAASHNYIGTLRSPGTANKKHPCKIVKQGYLIPAKDMAEWVKGSAKKYSIGKPANHQIDRSKDYGEFKFEYIFDKSMGGTGCQQIKNVFDKRGDVGEPMFHAVLSVMANCHDDEDVMLDFYERITQHSIEFTMSKAAYSAAPASCKHFDRIDPEVCQACPLFNHPGFNTPMSLGRNKHLSVLEATVFNQAPNPFDLAVQALSQQAAGSTAVINYDEPVANSISSPAITYQDPKHRLIMEVPQRGLAYYHGNHVIRDGEVTYLDYLGEHGITQVSRVVDKDGMAKLSAMLLTTQTVYVYASNAAGHGSREASHVYAVVENRHKGDEPFEFAISLGDLNVGGSTARKILGDYGVSAFGHKEYENLMNYLNYQYLSGKTRQTVSASHFGWTADYKSFVLGGREFKKDGTISPIPKSSALASSGTQFTLKGSVSGWVNAVAKLYDNHPAFAPHHICIAAFFAAPLYSRLAMETVGGLLHVWSPDSGTGKSTAQFVGCSMYGDYKALLVPNTSTFNALIKKICQAHSLPVFIEELKGRDRLAFVKMIYELTDGIEKDRLHQSGSKLQDKGEWKSFIMSTANISILDQIRDSKFTSDADVDISATSARILEVAIPKGLRIPIDPDKPNAMRFAEQHHGEVGFRWIQWLVCHQDEAQEAYEHARRRIMTKVSAQAENRYHVNISASIIAAAELASMLNLYPFSVQILEDRLISAILGTKQADIVLAKELSHHHDPANILANFISENVNNALYAEDLTRGTLGLDVTEVRNRIVMRVEPMRYCLVAKALMQYCRDNKFNASRLLEYINVDLLGGATRVNILEGTGLARTEVYCYVIPTARLGTPPSDR